MTAERRAPRERWAGAGVVAMVWVLAAALVDPRGDFPLNDDWAFGWSVKTLLDQGTFRLSDWNAANLVTQTYWGALVCSLFGFSFTVLRFSTLVLALVAVLALYGLLLELGARTREALLGALTLALNPIFFSLAHTFMSDVPSLAFSHLALCALVAGFRRRARWLTGLGLAAGLLALLNRQSNIVLFAGLGAALLAGAGRWPRRAAAAGSVLLLGLGAQGAFFAWLATTGRVPHLYGFHLAAIRDTLAQGAAHTATVAGGNLFAVALYSGAFLLPLTVMAAAQRGWVKSSPRSLAGLTCAGGLAAALSLAVGRRLPWVGNIWNELGVSGDLPPAHLSATAQDAVEAAWLGLTAAAALSAAVLGWVGTRAAVSLWRRRPDEEPQTTALLLGTVAGALGLLLLLSPPGWFDRYLLLLFAPLVALLLRHPSSAGPQPRSPGAHAAAIAVLALFGAFSVGGTHDYLAAQRARWNLLHALTTAGAVPPSRVDGGFEFNGWWFGNDLHACNPGHQKSRDRAPGWGDFTCLPGGPGRWFAVSNAAPAAGHPLARAHFQRWLPRESQSVFLNLVPGARSEPGASAAAARVEQLLQAGAEPLD